MTRAAALGLVVLLGAGSAACTGVAVREFTREEYQPAVAAAPVDRVFCASRQRLWSALLAVLKARGARIDERDEDGGRLVARLPWRSPDEAAEAVALGRVRTVVTRTERHYRSYSPLDVDCNDCVVRNGRVVDQRTEIVEDRETPLDPRRYHLGLRVVAELSELPDGTQLSLTQDVEVQPQDPPGLEPRSTGRLERALIDEVVQRVSSADDGLR